MANTTNTTKATEFAQLDPRTLVVGANARVDVQISADLVESIREHGVMQAITATRDDQGRVVVLQGQRRTLAVEAEADTVPVMIVDSPADEVERIVQQVEENDRRHSMSGIDRVAVAEQLFSYGLSAGEIAQRTRRDVAEVTQALSVAQRGGEARERLYSGVADLQQAAWLAEWADDPEATERLEDALQHDPGRMAHLVARLRRDKAEADRMAHALAAVEQVTGCKPEPYPAEGVDSLRGLRTPDGQRISKADHLTCPGNVVMVEVCSSWRADGQPMPYRVVLGCRDSQGHGHIDAWNTHRASTQSTEERRAIREGNSAWRAATEVRGEWLANFAKASKMPKGGEAWTAYALAQGQAGNASGWGELTGRTDHKVSVWDAEYGQLCQTIEKLTPARAAVASLVMALANYEASTREVGTWRITSPSCARYLRQLAAWGYTLSEAEATFCANAEASEAAEG